MSDHNRGGASSSLSTNKKVEDPTAVRLRRAWRSLASSLVVAARAAERAAKSPPASTANSGQQPAAVASADGKAMDDALLTTLRARTELRRVASLVEGKLRGNAREAEALECFLRTQPCAGKKRKREKYP